MTGQLVCRFGSTETSSVYSLVSSYGSLMGCNVPGEVLAASTDELILQIVHTSEVDKKL